MPSFSLPNFLALLPAPAAKHPLQQPYAAEHGVVEPAKRQNFVAPTLQELFPIEAGRTSVVLLSAPGAVGKTMLAERIAFERNSPLWRLGVVPVGSAFTTGTIAETFGHPLFSTITTELALGQRVLVFDSLDEARLASGRKNFDGFLDSVAGLFRASRPLPSLVLLGRTESVDYAATTLDKRGVPVAWYQIEYFDDPSAKEFVEKYLANLPHARIRATDKIRQSSNFGDARNAILGHLGDCAPTDPRAVVGYAPVLIVVSEYLNEGNPHGLLQKVAGWKKHDPAKLLAQIARELLEREQRDKAIERLPKVLGSSAGFIDWSKLYAPEEQCLRLLARECQYDLRDRPPAELPNPLRNDYEKALEPWIEDHPFRGQQVFREYTYTWLLGRGDVEAGLRDAIRRWLTTPDVKYLPSPLLSEFLLAMNGDESPSLAKLKADDFGLLYESVLSGCARGEAVRLSLASLDSTETIAGEITWFDEKPAEVGEVKPKRRLELLLEEPQPGVWFWQRLSAAHIQIGGRVRLGAHGGDLVLGPDVDVECETIVCDAETVRVVANTKENGVILAAQSYGGDNVPQLLGPHDDRKYLQVSWDRVRHPWVPYRAVSDKGPITATPRMREASQKLRRILVWFQASGYDDLARSARLIENPAVAGRGEARDLLDYCIKTKLIRKSGGWYLLIRDQLNALGINWHDVKSRNLSSAIAAFLDGFLKLQR